MCLLHEILKEMIPQFYFYLFFNFNVFFIYL